MNKKQTLPRFREIANLRLSEAGRRDKTINIKVAINTARMMVEREANEDVDRTLLANALQELLDASSVSCDNRALNEAQCKAEKLLKEIQ